VLQPSVSRSKPHTQASLGVCPSTFMERRHSFGGDAGGGFQQRRLERDGELRLDGVRGSAINYPGNPHFRPSCAFKTVTPYFS
jgi:hypothetical protein